MKSNSTSGLVTILLLIAMGVGIVANHVTINLQGDENNETCLLADFVAPYSHKKYCSPSFIEFAWMPWDRATHRVQGDLVESKQKVNETLAPKADASVLLVDFMILVLGCAAIANCKKK